MDKPAPHRAHTPHPPASQAPADPASQQSRALPLTGTKPYLYCLAELWGTLEALAPITHQPKRRERD